MQAFYAPRFEREMGCTEQEWLMWLPAAVAVPAPMTQTGPGQALVPIGAGCLRLSWQVLPALQIALMRLPRLAVCFEFEGVTEDARHTFMRRFDLYMQRGGG